MTSSISDYHYVEENQPDLMAGTEWSLSEHGKAIFESTDAPYSWGNINVGSPTLVDYHYSWPDDIRHSDCLMTGDDSLSTPDGIGNSSFSWCGTFASFAALSTNRSRDRGSPSL